MSILINDASDSFFFLALLKTMELNWILSENWIHFKNRPAD